MSDSVSGLPTKQVGLPLSRRLRNMGVKTKNFVLTSGKQSVIIIGALIVLVTVFTILNPNFIDKYNIVSLSQSLAPYAIMGLGVTFVIATGGIDLSIGTVCIASALLAGKLYNGGNGIPLPLVIPIMIIVGGLFGVLNGYLIAKLKMPAFIATLGTMLVSRGLAAIIVEVPNIFFPQGTWFNSMFSSLDGFPIGLVWVVALTIVCMYFMYKNKVGRYILSIGSNEEATRLSGINTVKYKWLAYIIAGVAAGMAAIFWAAAFPSIATGTGNGMELDAIAGVYIGGTSAAGGVASIIGTLIGASLLVVIRSGLNFVLARFSITVSATYATFVITGIIVVGAVLLDVIKTKRAAKPKLLTSKQNVRNHGKDHIELLNSELDAIYRNGDLTPEERQVKLDEKRQEILIFKSDLVNRIRTIQ